jgi:hypothetical protein
VVRPGEQLGRAVPAAAVGDAGVQQDDRGAAARPLVGDDRHVEGDRSPHGAILGHRLPGRPGPARRTSRADEAAQEARDVLVTIAEVSDPDRTMAERVHAVVTAAAPSLAPGLRYGVPASALDGAIVCFFRSAGELTAR